ncbi:MAG: PA14 domain-containing protein, partial [Phocaeicola sp.]
VEWYRNQSAHFTKQNNNIPLPSLAFFHIPLIEYKEVQGDSKTFGTNKERGIASSSVNSGAFASFIDMKDVMGVFVGHDHNNDFIGINKGIALAYGRVTGADAYGELNRGARIIKLIEGKGKFDTWISTKEGREPAFYYPSGFNEADSQSMNYLPAVNSKSTVKGVHYNYYEGECKKVADIAACKKISSGTMANISIKNAPIKDYFAFDFTSLILIPEDGVYRFYTYSDDGSQLYIDEELVVDNDGGHSARRAEGIIALKKGFHKLKVLYFERYMGETLEVGYSSRYITETTLSDEQLYLFD